MSLEKIPLNCNVSKSRQRLHRKEFKMAALVLRKLFGSATEIYFAQRRRVLCCSFSNKSPQFSKGVSTGNPTQTQVRRFPLTLFYSLLRPVSSH